jgi:quercetin dioxygenase-like cupin family protein
MRKFVAAAFVAAVTAGLACADQSEAATLDTSLDAPAVPAAAPADPALAGPAGGVRIAMRRQILAPGGKLNEDQQAGERYLFVVSGRLRVSDLVTGEEQVVGAGKMAAEQAGDWHVAEALGREPVVLYVIDRTPTEATSTTASSSRP